MPGFIARLLAAAGIIRMLVYNGLLAPLTGVSSVLQWGMAEKTVIACNYREGCKTSRAGALCFVLSPNPGGGCDRVRILARSRGGRLVSKWEAIHRLHNFRPKTVVSEDAGLWGKLEYAWPDNTEVPRWVETLSHAATTDRQRREIVPLH